MFNNAFSVNLDKLSRSDGNFCAIRGSLGLRAAEEASLSLVKADCVVVLSAVLLSTRSSPTTEIAIQAIK